jgi:hypothetical protein
MELNTNVPKNYWGKDRGKGVEPPVRKKLEVAICYGGSENSHHILKRC